MDDAPSPSLRARRPWLLFSAAGVVGFLAAGGFASSTVGLVIFLVSVFAGVFLATLAHGLLTEPRNQVDSEEGEIQSPVGFPSI
jgi:hypothetical protein